MYRLTEPRRTGRLRRTAFTLIEILVVIAIIGVLAALTAGAVMRIYGTQPVTNTRVMLKKTQTVMHKRWVEVTEQARKEAIQGVYLTAVQSLSTDAATQRVIYIKIRQKQAFPETFYEALNPIVIGATTIPAVPGYVTFLNGKGITAASVSPTSPQKYESAVCLLMALKRSVSGGNISEQDMGIASSINTTIAPGNAPCLIDGWGNPIGFSRWPQGNPNNGTLADPTDPGKLLWNANNWSAGGAATFANPSVLHFLGTTPGNLTPVVASGGSSTNVLNQTLTFGTPGAATQWKVLIAAQNNDVLYSNNIP